MNKQIDIKGQRLEGVNTSKEVRRKEDIRDDVGRGKVAEVPTRGIEGRRERRE